MTYAKIDRLRIRCGLIVEVIEVLTEKGIKSILRSII
jgi:hypothetical protein